MNTNIYNTKNHHQRIGEATLQVNQSYGDVPHLFGGASIPICPKLNEAKDNDANIEKIRRTTNIVLSNIRRYEQGAFEIDFNSSIKTLFNSICELFKLRKNKRSKYVTYLICGDKIMEFRFGDHDAFGDNFNSNSDLNISIYVAYYYYSNRGFSKTPYSEWVIDPDVFESNPKSVIDAMTLSIKNVIINGLFQMDNSVASKVDTTKPDSLADIVKMYCENNNKKIIFTFIDATKKRYNFTVDDISDYNKQSLSINITANQQQSVLLVDNEGKCSVNGNFIAPTRDISDKWKNFIECVRNWINKSIKESKQNMKKNVQRINESQLRAIVAESVKKVLNEAYADDDADFIGRFNSTEFKKIEQQLQDALSDDEYGTPDEDYGVRFKWCGMDFTVNRISNRYHASEGKKITTQGAFGTIRSVLNWCWKCISEKGINIQEEDLKQWLSIAQNRRSLSDMDTDFMALMWISKKEPEMVHRCRKTGGLSSVYRDLLRNDDWCENTSKCDIIGAAWEYHKKSQLVPRIKKVFPEIGIDIISNIIDRIFLN